MFTQFTQNLKSELYYSLKNDSNVMDITVKPDYDADMHMLKKILIKYVGMSDHVIVEIPATWFRYGYFKEMMINTEYHEKMQRWTREYFNAKGYSNIIKVYIKF